MDQTPPRESLAMRKRRLLEEGAQLRQEFQDRRQSLAQKMRFAALTKTAFSAATTVFSRGLSGKRSKFSFLLASAPWLWKKKPWKWGGILLTAGWLLKKVFDKKPSQ